jgi:hypothetical protein
MIWSRPLSRTKLSATGLGRPGPVGIESETVLAELDDTDSELYHCSSMWCPPNKFKNCMVVQANEVILLGYSDPPGNLVPIDHISRCAYLNEYNYDESDTCMGFPNYLNIKHIIVSFNYSSSDES